ncbi:hypothetical protein [Ruminococcus sp.]|uniref:hypothetical protein n=1 Tax=Ruminococcus sp. TaxID=41978 RepID=UPI0025E213F1|nr:hypothetical protein [Ruminococcus sp.]MBQ8965194.1 hypothetical protein [Ruminococcus sp.]
MDKGFLKAVLHTVEAIVGNDDNSALSKCRQATAKCVRDFVINGDFCSTIGGRRFMGTIEMTDTEAGSELGLSKNTVRAKRYQYGEKLKAVLGYDLLEVLTEGDFYALQQLTYKIFYHSFYSGKRFLHPAVTELARGSIGQDEIYDLSQCDNVLNILAVADSNFIRSLVVRLPDEEQRKLAYLAHTITSGDENTRQALCFKMFDLQGKIGIQLNDCGKGV